VEPVLTVEKLQETPGRSYRRVPARTFPVPTATIIRAHALAAVIGDCERREHTPLSFQGYGDGDDNPQYGRLYPADARLEDEEHPAAAAATRELRALWNGIPPHVQGDLIADWQDTGNRHDHPAYPFIAWATVQLDLVDAVERLLRPPHEHTRTCDHPLCDGWCRSDDN
jgi:hypothetical protein